MSIIPRFFMEATVVLGRLPILNPRWCATGFVVGRYEGTQDGNEKFSTYLITNRHVVENEEKMVMQVNLQNGVKAYLLSLASENSTPNYSAHPAADVIACHININPALSEGAQLPFFDLRHHTVVVSVDSIKEVVEIERTRAYGAASNDCILSIEPYKIGTPVEIPACVG